MLGVLSACGGPAKTAAVEKSKFDGTWAIESAELGGQVMPAEFNKTTSMTLSGDQYVVTVGQSPDRGTFRVDESKSPKTMDITGTEGPNKGKTIQAIYELTGDKLRVCYDLSGGNRPTEFASKPDSQLCLVTYHRGK
jgi:uncharacterized protein (TIGR03067 family)